MKKYRILFIKKALITISILSLLIVGCEVDTAGQYSYRVPDKLNDGIEVCSLDDVNINSIFIEEVMNTINRGRYEEVHAMLIFKDDRLVFEEYFKGHQYKWDAPYHHGDLVAWDRTNVHNIMSATKSVTSACIGIAIDHGFIQSVHESIFDYLPAHQHLKVDGKNAITIEHLLTMTSGLQWKEWSAPYSSGDNPAVGIWFSKKDPVSFILEKQLLEKPGTSFNYSTGNMILLGEILRNATKMTIDKFSDQYLFQPLEIEDSEWILKFDNGVDGNNLKISPRAMAKIGVMFLNNGIWNGERIISEQWVEKSAKPFNGNTRINIPGEDSGRMGYSYSWWTKQYAHLGNNINMYAASGFGGQHIMVLQELNTVVVFTGGNYLTKRPPFKILKQYIIPAIKKG